MNPRSPGYAAQREKWIGWALLLVAGLIVLVTLIVYGIQQSKPVLTNQSDVTIVWSSTGPGATIGVLTNNTKGAIGPLLLDASYERPVGAKGFLLGSEETFCDPVQIRGRPFKSGEAPSLYVEAGESCSVQLHLDFNLVKKVRIREGSTRTRELSVESVLDFSKP